MVSVVKNRFASEGDRRDTGFTPGSGRPSGGGHGSPPQCSCLEKPWTEEPGGLEYLGWQSQTAPSASHFHFHAHISAGHKAAQKKTSFPASLIARCGWEIRFWPRQ